MDAIKHIRGEVQETPIILLDVWSSPRVSPLPGYITLVTCTKFTHMHVRVHIHATHTDTQFTYICT